MNLLHRDIQFATTADGVRIAYWDIGTGVPIIIVHSWNISHAELEWTVPSIATFYEALAERYRVIKLDPRGHGLSDTAFLARGVSETGAQLGLSTEEVGLDIAAVAAACGLDRFALMAVGSQGPAGIDFAVRYPQALVGLILCDTVAAVESSYLGVALRTLSAMAEIEADSGIPVAVTMWGRSAPGDEMERWSALERANRPIGARLKANIQAMLEWDASQTLGAVETPTLILSSRNPDIDFLVEARKIAAGIPNAQLRMVDGTFAPYAADHGAVLYAIGDLLGTGALVVAEAGDSDVQTVRTVVFTDIVGSTAFLERVGDAEGRSAMRAVEQLVVEAAAAHGGTVVKHLGDGSLISFASNAGALGFAVAVQARLAAGPLGLRIGMAAGEPIQEADDIHGAVVAQASRVAGLGGAGEVIVTDSVRQLAIGKGYSFDRVGEVPLKGFRQPITVWRVVS